MASAAEKARSGDIKTDKISTRQTLIRSTGGRLVSSVRGLDELLFGSAERSTQPGEYASIHTVVENLSASENPRDVVEELAAYTVELLCCEGCAALWFDESLGRSVPIRGSFFSQSLTDRLVEYLNGGVVESVLPGERPALISEKEVEGPGSSGMLLFVPLVWETTPLAILLSVLPEQETARTTDELELLGIVSKFAALRIDHMRSCQAGELDTSDVGELGTGDCEPALSTDKALRSLAHSINNSLQVVLGAIRLCMSDPGDDELVRNLRDADDEAEKVNQAVGELVTLASNLCGRNHGRKLGTKRESR
jgi:hypothetical protein